MPAKRRPVKRRPYHSPLRISSAARTRERILDVARDLLVTHGYAGFTMQELAERADVALDTVYATIGRKPQLARLLIETAISNTTHAVPAAQRTYVQQIQAAPTAREKLGLYAAAIVQIQGRLAPIVRALAPAAAAEPELAAVWHDISERRARNMQMFAAELMTTGELRPALTVARVADVIWAMNGPELYTLLVTQRGWSPTDLEAWLADAWGRLLLG